MTRRIAILLTVILSALVLAILPWRIAPLLPERGGKTCFSAAYDPPRPVDLSSPRRDQRSVGEIRAMKVQVSLPPDERPFRSGSGGGYDWRYSLRLQADMADGRRLSSAAICEWTRGFDEVMPMLSCYIDCDGGGVTIWRKFGRSALAVRFEAGERLKTGGSCGDGGTLFIGAEKEARSFAVKVAPIRQCEEK